MGFTASQHAQHLANLAPPIPPALERGHGRGRPIVDRSRTDALELRGIPAIGRGVSGAMRGSRPGIDSAAALERDESELARALIRQARGNLKRARRSDYQARTTVSRGE